MMKRDFICGLDIGTYKICATCGMFDASGKIDILGSQTLPAAGFRSGTIIDRAMASACIKDALDKLQKSCGLRIKRVYVNFDSFDLRVKTYERGTSFAQKAQIRKQHVQRLINSLIHSKQFMDRKVIYARVRDFVLDDQLDHAELLGRWGRKLKLNIITVSALIPTVKEFIKCIRDAGLVLSDILPSAAAQAFSLLREPDLHLKKNTLLIDIGAGSTKLAILNGQSVKEMEILPFGSGDITEEIAVKLKLPLECAEQLKIEHGQLHYSSDSAFAHKIILRDRHLNRIIPLPQLSECINIKVEQLLLEIKKALLRFTCQEQEINQAMITGGGSVMEGLLEEIEQSLHFPVKMGFLSSVNDRLIQAQSAFFATSIGLVAFGLKTKSKLGLCAKMRADYLQNLFSQTEALYREYF